MTRRSWRRVAGSLVAGGALVLPVFGCIREPGPLPPVTSVTSATTAPATTPPSSPAPPGAAGPRALPPTFVPLEIGAFPRPADERCGGGRPVVDVAPGQSIAAAVSAAGPGTTIRVASGTYTENPEEATALAWRTPDLCLESSGSGPAIVQAAPNQKYGIEITGDDTVIRGLTIRGFEAGIGLNATEGQTQHRVTIERVSVEQMTGSQRDGIVAYGDNRGVAGTPPTVDGLLLLDVQVAGADLSVSCNAGPCAHWWVERTTLTGRVGSEDSGADAFAIEEGRQIAVVDSTVTNASADGIDTKADDVVVFASRVRNVRRNGLKLWRGGDVIDTVVDGTGADASLVGDRAGRYRYLHTLIAHHGGPGDSQYVGTWGYNSPDEPGMRIEFINCIFWENATGGLFAPASASVFFQSSLFADDGAKLLELSDGSTWDATPPGLNSLEASGRGAGDRLADPDFVDATAGTYSTRAGSAARDAGVAVNGLARDLTGAPRTRGTAPDIGPVESP